MSLKQSFVAWVMQHKLLFRPGHRAIEWPFFLGYIPLLRDIILGWARRKSTITYLPINETLRSEASPCPQK